MNQQYNEAINQYNDKAKEVIAANDGFDEIINTAQALVDCGDIPYEGARITTLSNSIKDARNNKVPTPELKEVVATTQVDFNVEKERKSDIDAITAALESELMNYTKNVTVINSEKDALNVPDYSVFINTLTTQSKELENDPNGNLNKPGGYTSTVYFGTPLLGTGNLTGNAYKCDNRSYDIA